MKQLPVSLKRTEVIPGWIYLLLQLSLLPSLLFSANHLLPAPASEAQLNLIFFLINFICIWIIFRRYLINSAKVALNEPILCLRTALFGLCAYWLSNFAVSLLITTLLPDFQNLNDQSIQLMSRSDFPLIAIGTVLLVPTVEEVLYRGLLFHVLYGRNRFAAYAVSALVFSAVHVLGYIDLYTPAAFFLSYIQYIPAGLCLCWAYERAGSVWAPILIHTAVNTIGILSLR